MSSIINTIGNTPLIELKNIYRGKGRLFCKLEYFNPGGSIKDRAALQIIKDAYLSGNLNQGQVVVEMTSGNLGAGLALVCQAFGNKFIAVMPEGNSKERGKIIKAFGGDIIISQQADGENGIVTGKDIHIAKRYAEMYANQNDAFYVNQFNNLSSFNAHYISTGPEIYNETKGSINAFIAIIGSGGTFLGTSKYLKHQDENIKCVAVEPENASILKNGNVSTGKHIIQGTGYGVIPKKWNDDLCDEIITVTDEEVVNTTKELAKKEGIYSGYSSGANILAAIKYLEKNNKNINVVTVICDTAYKYSDL